MHRCSSCPHQQPRKLRQSSSKEPAKGTKCTPKLLQKALPKSRMCSGELQMPEKLSWPCKKSTQRSSHGLPSAFTDVVKRPLAKTAKGRLISVQKGAQHTSCRGSVHLRQHLCQAQFPERLPVRGKENLSSALPVVSELGEPCQPLLSPQRHRLYLLGPPRRLRAIWLAHTPVISSLLSRVSPCFSATASSFLCSS